MPPPNAPPLAVSQRLAEAATAKQSLLCVGLDPLPERLPAGLPPDATGVRDFCTTIVDATLPHAIAYKPNLAFFEALGGAGWDALAAVVQHIGARAVVIADAKRGDIGHTATQYARAVFDQLGCDAVTLSPYMGQDSLTPFLQYPGKLLYILALTSNAGASDLQLRPAPDEPLFVHSIRMALAARASLADGDRGLAEAGFVVGATRPEHFRRVREEAPDAELLVPGIGAQGGSVADVLGAGKGQTRPALLLNSSRKILYAGNQADWQERAAQAAEALKNQTWAGAADAR